MDRKKDMYRDQVLKTAINLYANYGIRGVSMGQIAGALRISKKTLYEEFGNKEELLCTCIEYDSKRVVNLMIKTIQDATNPVEVIILMTYSFLKYKSFFCSSFQKDIVRFRTASEKMDENFTRLTERYCEYLQKGSEEGYFQSDLDCTTTASVLVELLSTGESSNNSFLVFTFLRGLCTDKGLEVINSLTPDNTRKEIYNYN